MVLHAHIGQTHIQLSRHARSLTFSEKIFLNLQFRLPEFNRGHYFLLNVSRYTASAVLAGTTANSRNKDVQDSSLLW
jgi:hypothetical protein